MFSVLKMFGVRLKILSEHKAVDIIRNMQGEYMTEAGNNYSEKKTQLHISVRNLVEFIFREGDIDNRSSRAMSADAMMEGTRIHRKIQSSMGKEYQAEVPLSLVVEGDLYELTVEGRADGIFTEDGKCFVDEIKGMYRRVELFEKPVFVHRAQAMCYAYIFALQNNMETIGIQMTYCNLETEQTKYFREEFSFEEIKKWFDDLMEEYGKWATFQCEMKNQRQASIKELNFPFEYRPGQKKLVSDVYRTIMRQKLLFMQAPTGVGKTISTIFPAVKAVGEELADRIFYLTAKTITATVAKETFALLEKNGYRAKTIQITAKEKLCPCDEMECNPVTCPYAKGHFDRVNDAVFDLLHRCEMIERDDILSQADRYTVCPFELCLDTASWCDNIICDYNYVFDPNVYLKRFFQEGIKGDYIFLIDEAHNMVERSRQMYSAQIYKEDFLTVKRIMKEHSRSIEKALEKCNKILLGMKRECENYTVYDTFGNMVFSFMRLMTLLDEFLQKANEFPGKKDVMDFYFELRNFLNIYDLVDEHYVMYSELEADGRFMLKLFCVDPSLNIQKRLDKGRSAVFFSATFLPVNYYKSLLSTKKDNYAIYADSTFDSKKRLLAMATDVSTRYTRRSRSEYERIAGYINAVVTQKTGNYMVFFPSYKMMNDVADIYCEKYADETELMLQKNNMSETEREEFLDRFSEETDRTLVAFGIMGGIFGEGIDLKNDRLIGAIVVGTGLPQISNERTILKDYYDAENGCGFDYAFRYPGINKVLQAAGRVIRTTEDTGVILLLDERFWQREYDLLYPREWSDRKPCNIANVGKLVADFWEQI
ncbi:ATP-dependent DNA helicase [Agathobacter rectalis]|uniref:ATP-dependent DNA helicase n=1 Tax=Agathobacter rectalis TaxID=39491 RepID=UPI000E4E55FA|nr:ATP-dependent DNA helicase [Agathobacter rectalis]RHG22934.1 ATP-dependent DNA helicase [Agathobacter rectalis]